MTEELKQIYSNTSTEIVFDTLILSHSTFSNPYYLVNANSAINVNANDTGLLTEFIPNKFDLILPTAGSNQQDMKITLESINYIFLLEIDKSNEIPEEKIKITHITYIDGNIEPQTVPLILEISDITISNGSVEAVASSTDTISKTILNKIYDSRYKGLYI